ncbi:MAG TPA: guanylate kinase [Lachnospiraceae bacterium]|nr:guanylate kinase [Lachnospiraceae bacterium]
MGRIICLMGKSASGKDTVFKELLADKELGLEKIVPYTTRPVREGEKNGEQYHFTDEDTFRRLQDAGKVIEDRAYHTRHGLWRYFTVNDSQLEDESRNYIVIGTLEAYRKLRDYFGSGRMLPVLLELEDGTRLQRALDREKIQEEPKYAEMCRRFLADSEDFSEEKIAEAGIERRFYNEELSRCLDEVRDYIISN